MFELLAAGGQGCAACERAVETVAEGLEGRLCLRCREGLPQGLSVVSSLPEFIDAAWSLGPYSGLLGALLRRAKYGSRDTLVHAVAGLLVSHVAHAALPRFQAVATVPSGVWRRLARGFDTVQILARGLPTVVEAPLRPVLVRRGGQTQAGKARDGRAENVRGAFAVRAGSEVAGDWLLVDDVLTTGATASACATALREAGARSVSLLVVASRG